MNEGQGRGQGRGQLRAPKWWQDLLAIPAASFGRRALYAVLLAAGVTMTGFGSIFLQRSGPIPYGLIPDLRFFGLMTMGLTMGLYASGGGAHRRGFALSGVVGLIVAFHLEEATIKWIAPLPAGSITGSHVGLLGTGGSLLALLAVMLMHIEVESHRLARDVATRGAPLHEAHAMTAPLAAEGARRVTAIAAGVAGLSLVVLAAAALLGETGAGGAYILLVGGLILVCLAGVLGRVTRRRNSA